MTDMTTSKNSRAGGPRSGGTKTGTANSGKTADNRANPWGKRGAPLRECVREAIDEYFTHLAGHPCRGLYAMVLAEVEAPLLERVMSQVGGNQRLAAEVLGMSRGTLRKKLREHGLLEGA